MTDFPAPGTDKKTWDTTTQFTPRFSADGLITAIAVDAATKQVVMVAHMNSHSLRLTLETGIAHYWSRSRNALWKKGETSGNLQKIVSMRTDCDQDVVMIEVKTADTGANCHTGRHSCFYRTVSLDDAGNAVLAFDDTDTPRFDPDTVYKAN